MKLVDDLDNIEVKSDGVKIGKLSDFATTDKQAGYFTASFEKEKLKKYSNQTLSFVVNMQVVKPVTTINNTINLDNNFYPKKDKEPVYTHNLKVTKTDAYTDQNLDGAEFVLKNSEGKFLQQKNNQNTWVSDVKAATKFTTVKGTFTIEGLKAGKYELVETKAPTGYVKSEKAIPVTVKDFENGQAVAITSKKVVNTPKGHLPGTGGNGIVYIIAVGAALVVGAGFYFVKRNKHYEA